MCSWGSPEKCPQLDDEENKSQNRIMHMQCRPERQRQSSKVRAGGYYPSLWETSSRLQHSPCPRVEVCCQEGAPSHLVKHFAELFEGSHEEHGAAT